MHASDNGRLRIILMGFGVVACSLAFIAYHTFQRLDPPLPATPISAQEINKSEKLSMGSPIRIIIPKIGVNAVLEYVGLTPEGEMEEPTKADNAAWLNRHPLPGEVGTSVIAGHFGFADNKPAVFDNLHKLRKGDKLYVIDSKDTVAVFVVQGQRTYMPEQDATEVFDSNDRKSHLNLITCKGAWDESRQRYDNRLVVFADRE